MPKVWNRRAGHPNPPNGAVYVGRPSKWGNPFREGKDGSRDVVIKKHKRWLRARLRDGLDLSELVGKDLVCWCAPKRCHADILLKLVNGVKDDEVTDFWDALDDVR